MKKVKSIIEEYYIMEDAVNVSAVRTPIGRANKGVLKDVRADDLAAIAVRAAVERVPQLDRALIEDVILGCAFPEGEQGMNLARLVGALAGLPETAGGVTVNRFCASSLQAFNMAAQNIMLGLGDVIVAGGVESMSRVPMGGFNPSFNSRLMAPREGEKYSSPYPPCELEYRSEEHTSELQSQSNLVCRLLLEKKTNLVLDLKFTPRSTPRTRRHSRSDPPSPP